MVANYKAIVESNEKISLKIYKTVVKVLEPAGFTFKAGQFASTRVKDQLRRSYSIGSKPGQISSDGLPQLDLYVDVGPMGPGSLFFMNAKTGTTFDFIGPLGSFTYREGETPVLFIATATGIAPLYSIICDELAKGNKRNFILYFGCRYKDDLFLVSELEELAKAHENFKFLITLSKPDEGWTGLRGRVTDHITNDIMMGDKYDAYVCGGQAMISDINEILLSKGISSENIFFEKFF